MRNITVEELHDKLASGATLHVIDVREQDEYDQVNIGAKLLPLSQLKNMEADVIDDWKDAEVIVHCRSGQRSMQACMILEQLGFIDTVNVQGGIMDWLQKYGDKKLI